jgi:CheY-like chemotaxis protein
MSPSLSSCAAVLVVEDDPGIRESMVTALKIKGYHCQEAANGQEALEALKTLPQPCLILLDLMMPIMSGWEFLTRVEGDVTLAQIPIAVVTAYSERAKDLKVKGILKKPIDLKLLFQVVETYCGLPRLDSPTT